MTPSTRHEQEHPAATARSFDELARLVGDEPAAVLAVPADDVVALRAARWLLGGTDERGVGVDRARDMADRLRRLADACQR